MSKVPPLLAAIVLGSGIAVCGYFVGDGIQHLKPNNRYVNVRGLSEKEVQADTAELTVSITRNANVTEELFPKLDAVQNQIIATFKSLGIKDDEIQPGSGQPNEQIAITCKTIPICRVLMFMVPSR